MKVKNKIILVFLFLLLIILALILEVEAIDIGVVDGYVKDIDGNIVSGAIVTATVANCNSGGCSAEEVSDNGGYYVISNLNIPKNGKLTVNVVKGSYSGSAVGNADEFYIAHINSVLDINKSIGVSGGSGGGSNAGVGFVGIISELTKQVFVKQIDPEIIKEPKNIEDKNIEEKSKSNNLIYLLLILSMLVILVISWIIYKYNKKKQKINKYINTFSKIMSKLFKK